MENFVRVFRAAIALCFSILLVPGGAALRASRPPAAPPTEKQLEQLCRGLKDKGSAAAYARLSAFARQRNAGLLGQRAALALGYYDYGRDHFPEAHHWLDQAGGDPILREYAVYWGAMVNRALGKNALALGQLEGFRHDFPQSVMLDQALQALAETALTLAQPARALAALETEGGVSSKPALLLLRGEAREKVNRPEEAAADYVAVYYKYPLSPSAAEAGEKMRAIQRVLGEKFQAPPFEVQLARAAALYDAHRWIDAREDYAALLPKLANRDWQLNQLRIAQCRAALTKSAAPLGQVSLTDPDLDAERLYSLAQAYRTEKREAEMLAAIEQTVARSPQSRWAEQALFAGGNYYWVLLDLGRAVQFYRRLLDNFPDGQDRALAHWRVAWQAYRERRPETAALLEEHLRKYPASPHLSDALYWLGRTAERAGNPDLARAYFGKLRDRYPQSYFGEQAATRLRALGAGPAAQADVLALLPPTPSVVSLEEPIPASVEDRRERAQALHTIAFDASEELEYRAAYAATGVPRLLLEAAKAAMESSHFGTAFVTIRLIFPQLESHPFDQIPDEVWRVTYPLPYRAEVARASSRSGVDPMLMAGLIRQESAFAADAVSNKGAVGLMQVLPKTAPKLARQARLRYSRAQLFDPEYNLRLGTLYFGWLRSSLGSVEAALAGYNAGEERVALWEEGRTYEEPAEFVESIPFTETRDYVQIVMRNGAVYRAVYGGRR